jgi:TctA family transporter
MTENNLRKTLMMFRGNISLILDRPIAMVFLTLALAFILFKILYPFFRRKTANPSSVN